MRIFIPIIILFSALTGFMVGTLEGQSTMQGTDQATQIVTAQQEPDRMLALEQEIRRLKEKISFDNARLRKEVDDLRMELLCREQVKFSKVSYQSTDGLSIPSYLFEPLKAGKYPAILWVHGGQHGTMSSRSLVRIIEWVQSGYVMLAPDYRGSSGYSEAFFHKADYGGKEIDDMVTAVDFLETLPSVIKKKIGIIGASHGGYNSLMAIIRYPQRFKVAVDLFAPTDLIFRLTSTPEENANTAAGDVEYFANMVGKSIHEAPELYKERSPRFLAHLIKLPLLILHGEIDQIVNKKESLWLIEELKKTGNKQFEYGILKGGNHGWPRHIWNSAYQTCKDFLDRYLK